MSAYSNLPVAGLTAGATLLVLAVLPTGVSAQVSSAQPIELTGIIRDFRQSHPDFDVLGFASFGHYAGNVALSLDAQGKPEYTGSGYQVLTEWRDAEGRQIAPHLFNTSDVIGDGTGDADTSADTSAAYYLTAQEWIKLDHASVIDSFDSTLGPYGGANVGAQALLYVGSSLADALKVSEGSTIMGDVMVTPGGDALSIVRVDSDSNITGIIGELSEPVAMPVIGPPALGVNLGELEFEGGTHTIRDDLHCEKLELEHGTVVNIDGDVTIRCDDKLEIKDGSELRLLPGATLTLYVSTKIEVENGSKLNMNTGNPRLVSILMRGFPEEDADHDDHDESDHSDHADHDDHDESDHSDHADHDDHDESDHSDHADHDDHDESDHSDHADHDDHDESDHSDHADHDDHEEGDDHQSKMEISGGSAVVAWIQAPNVELKIENDAALFGRFTGLNVKVENNSFFHVDRGASTEAPDEVTDDVAGRKGSPGTGGIFSAGTFDQWFRDTLGVNMSAAHSLTLTPDADGVYSFRTYQFHPINNTLLGNEGSTYNYFFTYEITADFTYYAGAGQFFEFSGTDDAWLFIDGKMVMDLGGIRTAPRQYVDMDRLGMADGQTYQLKFFFAQRHRWSAVFDLRTNLKLSTDRVYPTVTAVFD